MTKGIKKDFILEGLSCASCANKIEKKVDKIDDVYSASLNFTTGRLTIQAEDKNINSVIYKTNDIIQTIEPGVILKGDSKQGKKVLQLAGLSCTNCAAKIEKETNSIPGVNTANIDFVSKKMTLEVNNEKELNSIVKKASKIAKRIESGIEVLEENEKEEHNPVDKRKLMSIGIGAAIFLIAVIFKLPFWAELSLFVLSYAFVGSEVLIQAFKNILHGQVFDENFLMAIATIGAFAIGEFPEGVAVMLFYQIGEFFQDMAVNRSRKSISELMDIRPDYAALKKDGKITTVSPKQVKVGDIIIVKPGEKVPLDGKVINGSSMLDTSALTGESVPREVTKGDSILSGSINKNGVLTIKVVKEFGESTVSKILDLVENASSKKAPTENFITKFARYYTPVVVFAAAGLAFIPPLVISGATFSQWIHRALVFLVVSCPCALVVSIPLGFFGGIGGASKNGILIKGGNYLEALNNVDTVVFDKTGTLTKGVFKVTDIIEKGNVAKDTLLKYAAYAESFSNHPIAKSVKKAYGKNINKNDITNYNEISGHGIKVKVKDNDILVGNDKLMEKEGIPFEKTQDTGTIVHVAVNRKYEGYIVVSDEIKKDSKETIQSLKDMGVKNLVMLTGDRKKVGEKIGRDLGLNKVYSELLPDQKVEKLEELEKQKSRKGKLVFVGDGINDAPVLARSDIGVAMGALGSDAAIEAADVVLMTDEPSKIVSAVKISKRTRNIVWQNIVFAMAVKGIVLLLGSFGIATMWEAVFADVGVALIAVLNALRVLKVEKI